MTGGRDKTYILNPCYRLRNDIHRVVLFSKVVVDENSSPEWYTFIHPVQAGMFSFFTHNRRYEENLRLLSGHFGKDAAYMDRAVSAFIGNPQPVYTQWKGRRVCFPKNVLVEYDGSGGEACFSGHAAEAFLCKEIDLNTRRMYGGPLLITFMLTNRCLTRCRYCYADTGTRIDRPLSTPRILELIQEAADMQVRQVNLMGGEIFLHRDWDVILRELVRLDIAPEFISTKVPLTANHIARLKETGFRNVVQVSLDACNPDILSHTLKVPAGYCREMLKSLCLLDRSGLNYQVSSVLTTHNCDEQVLENLFGFLCRLDNLRDWRINPVSNSIMIDYGEFVRLKASRSEVERVFDYVDEKLQPVSRFPILLNRDAFRKEYYTVLNGSSHFPGSTCSALNTHMFILPDGKVTICEQLYWNPRFIIGDVTRASLQEVWRSPRALKLAELSRMDVGRQSPCKTCATFETCFGNRNRCWTDIIKAYGEDCWDYPDPRCAFAPIMKNNLGYE